MYVGGENPRKVFNLVLPKVPLYQQLYKKIFDKIAEKANVQLISGTHSPTYSLTHSPTHSLTYLLMLEQARQYTQDVSHSSRWNLAIGLPLTMRRLLLLQGRKRYSITHSLTHSYSLTLTHSLTHSFLLNHSLTHL